MLRSADVKEVLGPGRREQISATKDNVCVAIGPVEGVWEKGLMPVVKNTVLSYDVAASVFLLRLAIALP